MAKKKTTSKTKLAAADYDPLLVAISSRAVDTCLLGAKCLALLEDPRAFGLLMQLSRENDPDVRLETCRSFEQLGDQRATDRLCALLDDDEVKVRDAAFTALGKICKAADVPLEAASQGMAVSHEDVRMRGFELLVRHAKKSKANSKSDEVENLLRQALNDSKTVRNEAFKFVLNSKVGGGDDATLRFALQSTHADVRRDVLNEIMAEEKKEWAAGLTLEMLDDPDEPIRSEAFEYLRKKNKNAAPEKQIEWLSAAIEGKFTDIRLLACTRLVKINSPESQSVLKQAIKDDAFKVRQFALRSLIDRNATEDLVEALESPHVGVTIAAATALAKQNDQRAKPILENIATTKMPDAAVEGEEKVELWQTLTTSALNGLAGLEDPTTAPLFVELATHTNDAVRAQAAEALCWVAGPESFESFQPLLQHEDDKVKFAAAYAGAIHGEVIAGRMVLNTTGEVPISSADRLIAAIALGDATEKQLIQLLDMENDTTLPNSAAIVLLCRDWLNHDGSPRRIVAALAARDARLRLIAASAIQEFSDSKSLGQVIADVFNNRAEGKPFEIEPEVIRKVASVLVFGKPPLLCRVVLHLNTLTESKQDKWNHGWNWISKRYEEEIALAVKTAENLQLDSVEMSKETLDQLAFGTYVGLAREQGGYHTWRHTPRFGSTIANVRQSALRRLQAIAESNKDYLDPTISVITHTCGDPLQPVRGQAFEILKTLGVDDRRRAEIGINSGQLDLAVEGLNLLTSSAKKDERKEILKRAILNQPANIGIAAAKMLRDEAGSVETCEVCLESSKSVAVASVSWLADDYAEKPAAKKFLQKLALDSPTHVRERAIDALVKNKDDKAFDAIVSVVSETNPKIERTQCYRWFSQLGDSRANEFLLGLFDNPDLDIDPKPLLNVVGEFRDPTAVPKLLELMSRNHLTTATADVVYKISGFDQGILDPNDDWPDRLWVDAQHPRHGNVLANLMSRALELNKPKLIPHYIFPAQWCLTSEVDAPLATLVTHPDEKIRQNTVEAISFRAQKRDGSVEPLKSVVEHRDPTTQFLAAEGLAKSGHNEGIQVLMSAVEMMEDLRLRQRAVLALGCLADERALDQLLKLVTHDAHALQDCAAEAIGHLGQSNHKEKIFKILMSLVARQGTAGERALVGLRHMDVPEGWNKIREEAQSKIASMMRNVACQQLGYDSSDATQDLLVELLENPTDNSAIALAAARRCFGLESILPDLAYLRGQKFNEYDLQELELECLKRVCENATPDQIFQLVNECPLMARTRLANHVLALEPLPVKEAETALGDPDAQTVQLAAHVIGRNGDKKSSKAVGSALEGWVTKYSEQSKLLKRTNRNGDGEFRDQCQAVSRLIWAASRVGGGQKQLLDIVDSHESDDHFTELRRSAMEALQTEKPSAAEEKRLTNLLEDYDPHIRDGAGQLLAQKKSNQTTVAEALLADRRPFNRMAASKTIEVNKTLKTAASSAHYQPRALPHLIAENDVKTLSAVAVDDKLDLPSRLGAIEGLAKMADKTADKALVKIGNDEKIDESLRKAAWRGLRRSKRAKQAVG